MTLMAAFQKTQAILNVYLERDSFPALDLTSGLSRTDNNPIQPETIKNLLSYNRN